MDSILLQGIGIQGVDSLLVPVAKSLLITSRAVVGIMMAVAGMMVVFGTKEVSKPLWCFILGVGLVINFGSLLAGWWGADSASQAASFQMYKFDLTDSSKADFLAGFSNNYIHNIILPGAAILRPIAIRILLVLTLVDASTQIALHVDDGDHLRFLILTVLRTGFFIFLIQNWLSADGLGLMGSLAMSFQDMGLIMGHGGLSLDAVPDSIIEQVIVISKAMFSSLSLGINNISNLIVFVLVYFISLLCLLMTAIELFMATIIFYTFALIGLPLLAFGGIRHLSFLLEMVIGAVITAAIKLCVISFLACIICPFVTSLTNQIQKAGPVATNIPVLFQLLIASVAIFLMVRKLPGYAVSVLSGTPNLKGGRMSRFLPR